MDDSIEVEAASYGDAVRTAAVKLGIGPKDLGVELLDAGRSANSLGGFRPVKLRAWRRDPNAPPDGAGTAARPARRTDQAEAPLRGRRGAPAESYGPPPPPLDPAKITPAIVEQVRSIAEGIVEQMGFASTVTGDRTHDGVRIAISAGEKDQFLIGREGETLSALQHLVARMLRAQMPDSAIPRVEVDVAGFRDRRVESLRELARELIEEVRSTGVEAATEPLSAIERRIVHLEVAEVPGMASMSIGDGLFKRVVVRAEDGGDGGPGR